MHYQVNDTIQPTAIKDTGITLYYHTHFAFNASVHDVWTCCNACWMDSCVKTTTSHNHITLSEHMATIIDALHITQTFQHQPVYGLLVGI